MKIQHRSIIFLFLLRLLVSLEPLSWRKIITSENALPPPADSFSYVISFTTTWI